MTWDAIDDLNNTTPVMYYPPSGTLSGTSITSGTTTITYTLPSDTEVRTTSKYRKAEKQISASLYIKFVKSKLGKIQQEKAKKRLDKLNKLLAYSQEMGQRALYESLCAEIAILVREAEIMAYGIDRFISIGDIEKFRNLVPDKVIKFSEFSKFPRVVPKAVQTKFKRLDKAKVFDEFWILYIDYTGETLKTNAQKVREKDPILFGKFSHQPDRLYYIADWVDEYCDLTLDKFITKFKTQDPEYDADKIPDIDETRWKAIVQEVKERHERLSNTKSDNWRQLEAQARAEEAATTIPQPPSEENSINQPVEATAPISKSWWQKVKGFLG